MLSSILSQIRVLAIPGTVGGVFFVMDRYWQDIVVWIFGISGSQWVIDNLVLVPSFWPASVISLIVLCALVTARIIWINNKFKPNFSISDPREHFLPWAAHKSGEPSIRHFYITMTNTSFGNVENLSVREQKFRNVSGHVAPHSGRFFRVRTERNADPTQHTFTTRFDLRGRGDSVDFEICSMDEREGDSRVNMHYATEPTNRQLDAIRRVLFPHWLTIRVTASNMPQPHDRTYRIFITEDNRLQMEVATDGNG